MEAEVKQSQLFYELWAWAETNWRRLAGGAAAVALVALIVSFYVWRQGARADAASQALSAVRPTASADGTPVMPAPAAYQKIAKEYPGTVAAARASLLAGSALFEAGKYAEAKVEFDQFLRDSSQSSLRAEAFYGQAACLDAQGKTDEAITAFKGLVDRYPTDPLASRAKVSLARQYKAKNQPAEALRLLEDVARTEQFGTVGLMAETLITEIKAANPTLSVPAPAITNAVKVVPAATNAPAKKAK
jgi:tetratricopeptide (TPR) repeat protein